VQQVTVVPSSNHADTDAAVTVITAAVTPGQRPSASSAMLEVKTSDKPARMPVTAMFRAWLPELLACVFAALMIVAICALLAAYDNRLTTKWHLFGD
jgi:hypothetical protein